jgi:hypothetical protein
LRSPDSPTETRRTKGTHKSDGSGDVGGDQQVACVFGEDLADEDTLVGIVGRDDVIIAGDGVVVLRARLSAARKSRES